jgi:hypothetical protein
MFPAGYYYGGPLNEQIGPKNAIIPQAELDLHPTATLGITLKALFVWREDPADGLYDTPGFLILRGRSIAIVMSGHRLRCSLPSNSVDT